MVDLALSDQGFHVVASRLCKHHVSHKQATRSLIPPPSVKFVGSACSGSNRITDFRCVILPVDPHAMLRFFGCHPIPFHLQKEAQMGKRNGDGAIIIGFGSMLGGTTILVLRTINPPMNINLCSAPLSLSSPPPPAPL